MVICCVHGGSVVGPAGCYCMSAFFSSTGSANMFASLCVGVCPRRRPPLHPFSPHPIQSAPFTGHPSLVSLSTACNSGCCLCLSRTTRYFVFNVLFGGLVLTARNATITAIMYLSTFNFGFQVRTCTPSLHPSLPSPSPSPLLSTASLGDARAHTHAHIHTHRTQTMPTHHAHTHHAAFLLLNVECLQAPPPTPPHATPSPPHAPGPHVE
jgi:hypothetical protein